MLNVSRCCSCPKEIFLGCWRRKGVLSKCFKRSWLVSSHFWKGILLPQFSYQRCLKTSDSLLTLSRHLQGALERNIKRGLVRLDFSATFGRVGHRDLLHKLMSIGVGGQFFSKVCSLAIEDNACALKGKISASVDVVLGGAPE